MSFIFRRMKHCSFVLFLYLTHKAKIPTYYVRCQENFRESAYKNIRFLAFFLKYNSVNLTVFF